VFYFGRFASLFLTLFCIGGFIPEMANAREGSLELSFYHSDYHYDENFTLTGSKLRFDDSDFNSTDAYPIDSKQKNEGFYRLLSDTELNFGLSETEVMGFVVEESNSIGFLELFGIHLVLSDHSKLIKGFQIGVVSLAELLGGAHLSFNHFNVHGLFAAVPILSVGF